MFKFNSVIIILSILLVGNESLQAKEFNTELQKKMDTYTEKRAKAKDSLLKAIDGNIKIIRKSNKIAPSDKIVLIEALKYEKKAFKVYGILPFSPTMRTSSIIYLKSIASARAPLARFLEKKIDTKVKDEFDEIAKALREKAIELVGAKVVGVWHCEGINFKGKFTFTLYEDGALNKSEEGVTDKKWLLQGDKLIFYNPSFTAPAPKKVWIDECTIYYDGRKLEAQNQKKGRYRGELSTTLE